MRSKTIFAVMAAAATAFALMSFAGDARAQMLSLIPTYGNGKVQVRLYTDYFCSPCRAMEPKIAPVLSKLVRDNAISLTFTDVPLRPASSMYADYFLRAAAAKRDISNALKIRATLDEAAARGIKTPDDIPGQPQVVHPSLCSVEEEFECLLSPALIRAMVSPGCDDEACVPCEIRNVGVVLGPDRFVELVKRGGVR